MYFYISSVYAVVVVTGDEISNTPRDIISINSGQLPPPYPGRDGIYTAAVWHDIEDAPLTLVVGDGEVTTAPDSTQYINRRLSKSTTYGVFYYARLQSNTGNVVRKNIANHIQKFWHGFLHKLICGKMHFFHLVFILEAHCIKSVCFIISIISRHYASDD